MCVWGGGGDVGINVVLFSKTERCSGGGSIIQSNVPLPAQFLTAVTTPTESLDLDLDMDSSIRYAMFDARWD